MAMYCTFFECRLESHTSHPWTVCTEGANHLATPGGESLRYQGQRERQLSRNDFCYYFYS